MHTLLARPTSTRAVWTGL